MNNLKRKILVVICVLLTLWGFCYYYEVEVTKLIHASMLSRVEETTDDARDLMRFRLQQDSSEKNIEMLKAKLSAAKLLGTTGNIHLVDEWGKEVGVKGSENLFSCEEIAKVVNNKHKIKGNKCFLSEGTYQGIYNFNGIGYCLSYRSIGFNNWYIVAWVPIDKGFSYAQEALRDTFVLVIALVVIFALIALYIIYENHHTNRALYTMAYTDDITGLGNKNKYFSEMREMAKNKKSQCIWCLLFINIKNFKWVNDTFGIQNGNVVLRKIGETISRGYTTEDEKVMRIGADKFVVLKKLNRWEEPQEYVFNMLEDIGKVSLKDKPFNLKASVGGVLFRAASVTDGHTVLDSAVYAQQEAAKNVEHPIVFYSEDVVEKYKAANALMEDLKIDIAAKKNIEVFYQSKYDPSRNKIMGAEALIRWKHEKKGYIPPGEFIPLVEKAGFIWEVTKIVFTKVCEDIKELKREGIPLVPISVNFSSHDLFQNELETFLAEKVKEYDIQPGEIELEITETSIMFDLKLALNLLRNVKKLGFRLDVDDFGTGYSALSYLQEGVFDIIKLDRSFLLQRDKFKVEGEKLITSIVSMGKNLGLKCICEGAETKEQVEFLGSIKVDGVQGFFYAKPEKKEDFKKRLV